jgi:hypothetical protein
MSVESAVDDVRARLAQKRAERPQGAVRFGDAEGESQPDGLRLDLQDLDTIARRHHTDGYREGQVRGFREGHQHGSVEGAQVRHAQDMQTFATVAEVLRERLERIPDRLSAPPNGERDRRSKHELREEALQLVEEIRACFGVLLAAMVQGAFDEGS